MILVDTSIWIDYFRGKLEQAPSEETVSQMAVCPPVLQEILQGFDNESIAQRIQRDLLALRCLANPIGVDLYLEAASLRRSLRRKGVTIRSTNDCLIAAIAMRYKVPVWHKDRDFDTIARYTMLEVVNPL